jgi:hypothetical protein
LDRKAGIHVSQAGAKFFSDRRGRTRSGVRDVNLEVEKKENIDESCIRDDNLENGKE